MWKARIAAEEKLNRLIFVAFLAFKFEDITFS